MFHAGNGARSRASRGGVEARQRQTARGCSDDDLAAAAGRGEGERARGMSFYSRRSMG